MFTFIFAAQSSVWNGVQFWAPRLKASTPMRGLAIVCANAETGPDPIATAAAPTVFKKVRRSDPMDGCSLLISDVSPIRPSINCPRETIALASSPTPLQSSDRIPTGAVVADIAASVLIGLALIVVFFGEISRFYLYGIPMSIRTAARPFALGLAVLALRHWRVPHHPVLRRLRPFLVSQDDASEQDLWPQSKPASHAVGEWL